MWVWVLGGGGSCAQRWCTSTACTRSGRWWVGGWVGGWVGAWVGGWVGVLRRMLAAPPSHHEHSAPLPIRAHSPPPTRTHPPTHPPRSTHPPRGTADTRSTFSMRPWRRLSRMAMRATPTSCTAIVRREARCAGSEGRRMPCRATGVGVCGCEWGAVVEGPPTHPHKHLPHHLNSNPSALPNGRHQHTCNTRSTASYTSTCSTWSAPRRTASSAASFSTLFSCAPEIWGDGGASAACACARACVRGAPSPARRHAWQQRQQQQQQHSSAHPTARAGPWPAEQGQRPGTCDAGAHAPAGSPAGPAGVWGGCGWGGKEGVGLGASAPAGSPAGPAGVCGGCGGVGEGEWVCVGG